MPRRPRRTRDDAALREWLIEQERELITRSLTSVGYHQGKPIEPPPVPPTVAEVDAKIRDPESFAWFIGGWLRDLTEGRPYRLHRRDLPDWHPAWRVGQLSDALVLSEDNELIEAAR